VFAAFKLTGHLDEVDPLRIDGSSPSFNERRLLRARPSPPEDAQDLIPVAAGITVAGGHHLAGDSSKPVVSVTQATATVHGVINTATTGVAKAAVSVLAQEDMDGGMGVVSPEKMTGIQKRKKKRGTTRLAEIETIGRADATEVYAEEKKDVVKVDCATDPY
jgi:hypothetical protein